MPRPPLRLRVEEEEGLGLLLKHLKGQGPTQEKCRITAPEGCGRALEKEGAFDLKAWEKGGRQV